MSVGEDQSEAPGDGDRLASLLANFDAALKAGSPPEVPASPPEVATASPSQLLRAQACLRMLEEAWPRRRQSPAAVLTTTPTNAAGKRMLGRFELRRELGRGGFGVVHLAYDPQLGREVALKVPHAQVYGDPELHSRFQREARAAAGLNHPNIVPVYEAGEVDSVGYIALAYCPGITLHDWLRRRIDSVPGPAIAEFMATLAGAIHHAHEQGIIHRDLKPANVLLGGDWADQPGYAHQPPTLSSFAPKITDFGLAKQLDSEFTQTHTGTIAGTPCYMAPEQTGGASSPITPATDVYSLGAILYELLTGRAPFLGETVLDTLEQVRSQDPIPPRRLRPGIPRDLEIICLKCLEKDSGRRYVSAKALEEDLRRYHDGHSIVARPTGPISQMAKWARRRPAVAALVAVSALAVAMLIGSDLYIRQKNRETARALEKETRARTETSQALGRERLALYYHRTRLAQAALAENNVQQAETYLQACVPAVGQQDHRGWEWHYLQRLAHSERLAFRRHRLSVWDVALSEDGQRAVSISVDGGVKFWDAASGVVLWQLSTSAMKGPRRERLAFGRELVAVGDQARNVVSIHAARDGRRLCELPGWQCRFSPAGTEIAVLDASTKRLGVYDPTTGQALRSFGLAETSMATFVLRSERTIVATVDADFSIRVRTYPDGVDSMLRGLSAAPWSLALSEDGTHLAAGLHDGTLRVWDVEDGRQLVDIGAHVGHVQSVRFSPDRKEIATADMLGGIKVWNLKGHLLRSLPGHGYFVNALAYAGDGRVLASASADSTVKIWDAVRDPQALVLRGHRTFVHTLAFNARGTRLASGGFDQVVKIWDPASGEMLASITEQAVNIRQLAFSADGTELIGCNASGRINVWNVESGRLLRSWPAQNGKSVVRSALAPGGGYAASEINSVIVIRDTTSGTVVASLPQTGPVRGLAFSPTGDQLAAAGSDHSIRLWDTTTGAPSHLLVGHADDVSCLAFSSDGKLLASGGSEKLVRLWDVNTGKQLLTIRNQWGRSNLFALAFSPDGKRLAAGRLDATVMLWDVATGHEVVELPCQHVGVTGLVFSPAAGRLAAIINDGTIRVWNAAPSDQ